jgi:hypothetical protein
VLSGVEVEYFIEAISSEFLFCNLRDSRRLEFLSRGKGAAF